VIVDSAVDTTALALALGAAALLAIPERPRFPAERAAAETVPPRRVSAHRAMIGALAVAGVGLMLAPGLWWVVGPVAALAWIVLSRRPSGRSSAQRTADRRVVAVYSELLAACLDAGMAVGPALRAVSGALVEQGSADGQVVKLVSAAPGGRSLTSLAGSASPRAGPVAAGSSSRGTAPQGSRAVARLLPTEPATDADGPIAVLDAVAAMLSLGAAPGTAWRPADLDDNLAPLAAAARRSAAGGGGLAQAVREHAAHLRAETAAASVRAAGRAGVLMTAPLGICFLPAFLCLGLAPVVVGLLGQLDIF